METKRVLLEATKEIGIKALKPKQEAILSFLASNDTFVSLPTGYGKSVIYCLTKLEVSAVSLPPNLHSPLMELVKTMRSKRFTLRSKRLTAFSNSLDFVALSPCSV